ncbi:MAG: hypothetical protein ABSC20_06025 [Candidatus Bathyarchaeia archaeon]|jgi:hypothetical protein
MISSSGILHDIMKRILNDTDVFAPPYDRTQRENILLFQKEDWKKLSLAFEKRDKSTFNCLIDKRLQNLHAEASCSQHWRKVQIETLLPLGLSLKNAFETKPNLLSLLFDLFDCFGLFECRLPNMEDYGTVIENHTKPIVEQFFFHQINKANMDQKRALARVFEYVKELYNLNIDVVEIAFFVRKLNSLTELVEVIKDE